MKITGVKTHIMNEITNLNCTHSTMSTLMSGLPEKVAGDFDCSFSSNLKSLAGAPRRIGGNFYCVNCSGLSLEQIAAYKSFLKMSKNEQIEFGLLDTSGHYKPKF